MEKTFTLAEIKNILRFNIQEILISLPEHEATDISASLLQLWLQFAALEPNAETAKDLVAGKVDVELLPEYCKQRYHDSPILNKNREQV